MPLSKTRPRWSSLQWLAVAASILLVAAIAATWVFWPPSERVEQIEQGKAVSFLNVDLGVAPTAGVEEGGFYVAEQFKGEPFRWTDGQARLVIPIDLRRPPESVLVHVHSFRPPTVRKIRLRIAADGRDLFNDEVSTGKWEQALDLTQHKFGEKLTLDVESDTFVPKGVMDKGKSDDPRSLGVQVKRIRLVGAN